MEFVAILTRSEQCTEDHWEMATHVLKCNGETTLADLEKWYKDYLPHAKNLEFKICTLENNNA